MFGNKTLSDTQAKLDEWERSILKKDNSQKTQWEWEDMCRARASAGIEHMNNWWKFWKR
jgi:hypothetical protein